MSKYSNLLHVQDDIYLNPLEIEEIKYSRGRRSYYVSNYKHPLWIKREQALYEKSSFWNKLFQTEPTDWYNKAKWCSASVSFWVSGKNTITLTYDTNELAKMGHEFYLTEWNNLLKRYENE